MTTYKVVLSALAIGLTLVGFYPYVRAIYRGSVKPHVFTWVIWGITTLIVFFAQLEGRGGVGAWPIGVSAAITLSIAFLAYRRRADTRIVPLDWFFFSAALASLPLWYLTADPLWAVVLLTLVDVLGFGPTIRKSYHQPHSESLLFYLVFTVRNITVIGALEHYSLTTVLFPAVIALFYLYRL